MNLLFHFYVTGLVFLVIPKQILRLSGHTGLWEPRVKINHQNLFTYCRRRRHFSLLIFRSRKILISCCFSVCKLQIAQILISVIYVYSSTTYQTGLDVVIFLVLRCNVRAPIKFFFLKKKPFTLAAFEAAARRRCVKGYFLSHR